MAGREDMLGAEVIEVERVIDPYDPDFREDSESTEEDDALTAVQGTVTRLCEEALQHYEEELMPHQVEALDYYHGRPFGDEQEGRSKVVSTVVRDAIEAVMPSLLRIFLGTEAPVEYRARGISDIAMAEMREEIAKQATDYIRYIVNEDNAAFTTLMAAFDDALDRKIGVLKFWHDERVCVKAETVTGVTEEQLLLLQEEPGVELSSVEPMEEMYDVDPETGEPIELFRASVKRKYPEARFRIEAVPSEEFAYSPGARTLEQAPIVLHVSEKTVSDLVAMGHDREIVKAAAGKTTSRGDEMATARQFNRTQTRYNTEAVDPSMRKVLYTEAYALVDADGDDIAERRMFQCVGDDFKILNVDDDGLPGEIVDGLPFAVFTGRPLAHMIAGMDFHDLLKDIQRIASQIERGVLDSLALTLEPKTEVVEGKVNIADLLNPEINGIVRVDAPGMINTQNHQFVGPEALAVLEFYNHRKEERTGITKASQGLDADSLQSSTKAAVAGTLAAAQQRIEMIARALAETGMKQLFKGLLRLVVQHQDRQRVVKLRGRYVEVNPRSWDADMDVVVNVGLGMGTLEERVSILTAIAEDHTLHMQNNSPLVSWTEVRNVRARIVELLGYKNTEEFYKKFGPEEEQEMQQAQAQNPPPPDAGMALVEAEKEKNQMRMQIEQAKLQLEQMKMTLQNDREREKIARDAALKEYELELKYKAEIVDAELRAKIANDRLVMDANLGGAE